MARSTNTYVCQAEPTATSAGEWTKNGTGFQARIEAEGTPPEGNSYTQTANAKTLTGKFVGLPTLAAGEVVVKAQLVVYGKAGSNAIDVECFVGSTGVGIKLSSTAAAWVSTAVTAEEGQDVSAFEVFTLKTLKATASPDEVRTVYLILTTETERAWSGATKVKEWNTTANGEGKLETPTGAALALAVGRTAILYVTASGSSGVTSIIDPQGNTWTKDGEQKHGSTAVVQIWSSLITKRLEGTEKLTLNGLNAGALCQGFIVQQNTAMVATGKVDVTGGAEGTGEELEVVTPSMRASQGDWVAVIFGTTANSLSFVPTGFSGPASLNLATAGLSLAGGMINKPTEGATVTAKGKFASSGEMAVLVVAYKVLASAGETKTLSGLAIVKITATGGLAATAGLLAHSTVTVASAGHLATTASLRATASVQTGTTGVLKATIRLAGTSVVSVGAAGHLITSTGVNLRGTAVVTVSTTARLGARASLRATAVVNVSASGRITATGAARPVLVVYSTVIVAGRIPMTVAVAKPLPVTVEKAPALSHSILVE